ncbi:hypothetical protein LguiB_020266 [Lonicera macranthoides]
MAGEIIGKEVDDGRRKTIVTTREVVGEGGNLGLEKEEASSEEVARKGKERIPSLGKSIETIGNKSILILC